jgi:tripartite-type tricarboxylate transporter receptor subunit TctC
LLHIFIGAALLLPLLACDASADTVDDFYRGRNLSMIIGYNVGGGYDIYARIFAKYFAKQIPGQPNIVPQNMGGAGSRRAASYLETVAAKDGSVIGLVSRDLATEPLLGDAKIDMTKFVWLGSISNEISICATWHTSPVKTWNDLLAREATFGASSGGADTDVSAHLLRNLFGARIKLVTGYPGGSGINLAMERGEVEGRCGWSWSSVKSRNADWVRDKKINLLIQLGLEKSPDLPNVPLIIDVAGSDEQKQILRLIMSRLLMARPFVAPPGIPDDRKQALRKAFDVAVKDPEFLAEAEKAELEVNPVSGAEIDRVLADLYRAPKEVAEKAKKALQQN